MNNAERGLILQKGNPSRLSIEKQIALTNTALLFLDLSEPATSVVSWSSSSRLVAGDCVVLSWLLVILDLTDLLLAGAYTHCSFSRSSDIAEFLISSSFSSLLRRGERQHA